MIVRYSPYESPFVPTSPAGVHWIPRELRNAPRDAHVTAYYEHRASLVAAVKASLKTKSKNRVTTELESMAYDSGIKAAARRYRSIQNEGLRPFSGKPVAGEAYRCLD